METLVWILVFSLFFFFRINYFSAPAPSSCMTLSNHPLYTHTLALYRPCYCPLRLLVTPGRLLVVLRQTKFTQRAFFAREWRRREQLLFICGTDHFCTVCTQPHHFLLSTMCPAPPRDATIPKCHYSPHPEKHGCVIPPASKGKTRGINTTKTCPKSSSLFFSITNYGFL